MDNIDSKLAGLEKKECNVFMPNMEYVKVLSVYDGDTITIGTFINMEGDEKPYKFCIRLFGVDTPELRTRDLTEKQAGYFVRDKLREKIDGKIIRLDIVGYDKYGRILANIYHSDLNLNKWLIDNKYAYEYTGGTKQDIDWSHLCE